MRETFEAVNETIRTLGYMRTMLWVRRTNSQIMKTKFFQQMNEFYMVVTPINALRYTPATLYLKRRGIYGISLISELFSTGQSIHVFIHPYRADFEGLYKTYAKVDCQKLGRLRCGIAITYTTKITKLTPPPFDTACQDYSDIGFTSRENCLSECLTQFTERHGFVIGSNILKKEIYSNSSLIVIPWYFKAMWTAEEHELSMEKVISLRKQYSLRNNTAYMRMLDRMIEIFSSYCNHWGSCKKRCRRPDCITESNVPKIIFVTGKSKRAPLEAVGFYVYPSHDLITVVTSQPKLILLDLIIYLLSCINFWYGFSPLNITGMVTRWPRNKGKKRHIQCVIADIQQRMRRIEHRI